jgi:hypothetical protein
MLSFGEVIRPMLAVEREPSDMVFGGALHCTFRFLFTTYKAEDLLAGGFH